MQKKIALLTMVLLEILLIATFDGRLICRAEDQARYSIGVDKRIELLSAVQSFTSWREHGIWPEDYLYKQDVLNYFQPYSNHEAVTICEELISHDFTHDAPVMLMFCLSSPPELEIIVPFSEYLISRAGNATILEDFVRALRDFYLVSNFDEFWQSHHDFYSDVEKRASANIDLTGTVQKLENYFRAQQHGYHVVLAPFLVGNYGPRVKVNDSFDIYSVLSPMRIDGNVPIFGGALFHEFAHSFVNPITDEFRSEFKNPERLYEPIAAEMSAMAYDEWETMINEHIIRAIEIIVYNETQDIANQEQTGFIYIRPLINCLSKYNSSYESFQEFYPNIVDFFNNLAENQRPFIETPLGIAVTLTTIAVISTIITYIFYKKKDSPFFKYVSPYFPES